MNDRLFGSSGIRGLVNSEITVNLAQNIGKALATMYPGGTIVVGRDTRITGKMLEIALQSGIASGGAETLSAGMVPTPITANIITEVKADAGIEITASHNPAQYNGFKFFNPNGMSFTLKEQRKIENIINKKDFTLVEWDKIGTIEEINAIDPYIWKLLDNLDISREWNLAADLFCGATTSVIPDLFQEFNIQMTIINGDSNGKFPSGPPEPTAKSLKRLGKLMVKKGSDIGFGFDGDGDRMMPLNSNGFLVNPDALLASYAAHIVELNNGGIVVSHVGTSMSVTEMVEEAGGKLIRTPVGDVNITEAIIKHDAVFGGEPVGAWVHPNIHLAPDGMLSALKLMETLEVRDMTLQEFIERAPVYPLKRTKVPCSNDKKRHIIKIIEEDYQSFFKKEEEVSNIDGVRIKLPEGWVLIRPSGTEPIIRITVEGRTNDDVEKLTSKAILLIKNSMREIN